MLRSPKEKFMASAHRSTWDQLVLTPAFEEATFAALLQLQVEMPTTDEPNKAWDQASQLAGAKRFLDILTNLSNPTEKPTERSAKSLNYDAGV